MRTTPTDADGIDGLKAAGPGSSPVSPITEKCSFAGSSQVDANERAIPEGNTRPDVREAVFLALPPGYRKEPHWSALVDALDPVVGLQAEHEELRERVALALKALSRLNASNYERVRAARLILTGGPR